MGRYAQATLDFGRQAQAAWTRLGGDIWLARHGSRLEDARAVLEWAFAPGGDRGLGRALTAELSAIWLHLGLMRECLAWCRKALDRPPGVPPEADADEMKIQHAYGVAHGFTFGNNMGNRANVEAGMGIARDLGDQDYGARSLWALATLDLNEGEFEQCLTHARELSDIAAARGADAEQLLGERMMGCALHLLGRHAEARAILETTLEAYALPGRRASPLRFQYDQVVLTRGFLAWIDWIEGDDEGSRRQAETAVAEAVKVDHAGSLGFALDAAITLAILRGDLEEADRSAQRLREMGANVGFEVWMMRSEVLRGIIQVRSGDLAEGVPRLQAALTRPAWKMTTYRTPLFLAELAQAEAAAGLPEKALQTIDDAIAWYGGVEAFWFGSECLRVKADILAQCGGANALREAEALLERAAALAERQGAVTWRRRVEASLRALKALEPAVETAERQS